MAIHTDIMNFMRDAQYRIGELTEEINVLYQDGDIESPKKKHGLRVELLAFMEILYEINHTIDGQSYNHVVSYPDEVYISPWTEQMILDEIEYLRIHCGMSEQPLMTFVPFYNDIISEINNEDTTNPQTGLNFEGEFRQMLMFDVSGNLLPIDVDPYGGVRPNETIDDYFSGRP